MAEDDKIDQAVVQTLYVQHGEELLRFLVGVLRDQSLARDVLQTSLAKLIQRGHEARPESRKSWLFRVAFHEAMLAKRRKATDDRAMRKVGESTAPPQVTAEDGLVRKEVVEAVRDAMERLPIEQQRVVRLRVYEGLTFAEIARELKIPLGTALSRMQAALTRLRTRLPPPESR